MKKRSKRGVAVRPVAAVERGEPRTKDADAMARMRARRMSIPSKPEWRHISARRAACAENLPLFIETYLGHRFPLPNSPDQIECLKRVQVVALGKAGERQAQACPRGDGKTERTLAATLWAILYGHHNYVVPVCANLDKAKKIVSELEQELADNDLLLEDWPYICEPIRRAFGKQNRAKYLAIDDEEIRLECRTVKLVLPTWSGAPDKIGGSVVEGAPIFGVRGMRHATASGAVLRPTLVLIDDPQTIETASSPQQCSKLEGVITGDLMKMAGPRKNVSAFLNCTIIQRGDLADRFLNHKKHPEWRGVKTKMVYEWPKRKDLWERYSELRKSGILDGDKGAAATAFYLANREAMDEGAHVGWEHRYNADHGEYSAIQHAYNVLIDDGEAAFAAELQNEPIEISCPVIRLAAATVSEHCNGLAQLEAPGLACALTAFVDVNHHALAVAVVAFSRELAGSVVFYGEWGMAGWGKLGAVDREDCIWSEAKPAAEGKKRRYWQALDGLTNWLFARNLFQKQGREKPIDAFSVDVGYRLFKGDQTIHSWIYGKMMARYPVFASRGFGAGQFHRMSASEQLRSERTGVFIKSKDVTLLDGAKIICIDHDAEHHRRDSQIAWTLPLGSPDSLSVWGEQKAAVQHWPFCQQIAAKKLVFYEPIPGDRSSGVYRWVEEPGQRDEMSDCVVGARVLALHYMIEKGLYRQKEVAPASAVSTAPTVSTVQPIQQPVIRRPAAPQRPPAVVTMPGWGRRY